MTTTPVPPAGPALDPSGSPAPRDLLTTALGRLVSDGTLTGAQADAVLAAVAGAGHPPTAQAPGVPPAPVPVQGVTPTAPTAPSWRDRLLEAAVYLGSAFVLAAVGVVVQQQWTTMSRGMQLLLAAGLTAVALAAGVVVAWPVRAHGGAAPPGHAVRRRSGSVVLTLGVALATATTAFVVTDGRWNLVAAAAVAGVLMAGVVLVAPSVLAELALFVAGAALMVSAPDAAMPAPAQEGPGGTFDWAAVDLLRGGLLLAFGAGWAWGASRRLAHRELGVALGLAATVIGAMTTAGRGEPLAAALLGVVAVAAVLTYLKDPVWPWVVGAVGAVFFAVVLVGNRTLGPALTFLAAGLVLLGGTAAAVLVGRRRAARKGGHRTA
ncbi:MAG: hypothetical protein BGO37_04055 [Cellulomonas sp. 73-92]|uniref:hypothetical protein n=1 Tax=Cellulomonas sp. 73-92 TaxID=1895740 RepID=UPI00092926CC|nr:hypothetical protein [Cellulomonas sp. 73-92]OJV82174.1 MAG: hypothetical protein BGO37_04055 [Cellulomonas sp. 73-92]